jgi:hypothetical protein
LVVQAQHSLSPLAAAMAMMSGHGSVPAREASVLGRQSTFIVGEKCLN